MKGSGRAMANKLGSFLWDKCRSAKDKLVNHLEPESFEEQRVRKRMEARRNQYHDERDSRARRRDKTRHIDVSMSGCHENDSEHSKCGHGKGKRYETTPGMPESKETNRALGTIIRERIHITAQKIMDQTTVIAVVSLGIQRGSN